MSLSRVLVVACFRALATALALAVAGPASAYQADEIDAANRARVSIADMVETIKCVQAGFPEKPRASVVQVAMALEMAAQLSNADHAAALAACRGLLR
jgi:hypothetical protein